jgi:ATP-binding protein involved in chromosome partitioning
MSFSLNQSQKEVGVKKVIGVAAGKGGVGKSTLCTSLALASAMRGLKVGVLDADLYGPSIPLLLPQTDPLRVDEDSIIPPKSGNIRFISIEHFNVTESSTAFRAPVVNMFIEQCIHAVNWGDLDVLYVDFPPGVGDVHLSLLQNWAFSGVVLVTQPSPLSISDVYKAARSFQEMQVPIIALLENLDLQNNNIIKTKIEDMTKEFSIPVHEVMPLDPNFCAILQNNENPFLRSKLSLLANKVLEVEEQVFDAACRVPYFPTCGIQLYFEGG